LSAEPPGGSPLFFSVTAAKTRVEKPAAGGMVVPCRLFLSKFSKWSGIVKSGYFHKFVKYSTLLVEFMLKSTIWMAILIFFLSILSFFTTILCPLEMQYGLDTNEIIQDWFETNYGIEKTANAVFAGERYQYTSKDGVAIQTRKIEGSGNSLIIGRG
jgi:hypothetical protein